LGEGSIQYLKEACSAQNGKYRKELLQGLSRIDKKPRSFWEKLTGQRTWVK
jgi:hypothetical protein